MLRQGRNGPLAHHGGSLGVSGNTSVGQQQELRWEAVPKNNEKTWPQKNN